MSYAEAAASSGPAKEFEQKRKEAAKEVEKIASKAAKVSKEQAEVIKKEFDEFEKESAPYIEKALNFVKEKYAYVSSSISSKFNSESVSSTVTELQNPVVLSQLALIIGGATAGWFVYAERAHIRSENKYVVAIHAGIVTALVLGDVYVFQKLYPKYKKN
ncbi:hypothetical protein JCM33374_g6043 [Metschnikowia sp. JCM 33374]|nr:hypothetical protein JCM33374_g6043 [Metschnikowia sp. JCM 33374]